MLSRIEKTMENTRIFSPNDGDFGEVESGATKHRNFKSQKDSRYKKRPWAGCYQTCGSTWIVDIPYRDFLRTFTHPETPIGLRLHFN